MYAKLFARITESSIMESAIETRYVFLMLLAIADPKGYVIGTDVAIARRLNVSVELFEDAIKGLMEPDPDSNSQEEEGRRVIQSDGERGYFLVNYRKYREMLDEDGRREYMRNYMKLKRAKERGEIDESERKLSLAALTHSEEAEEAKPQEETKAKPPTYSASFEEFWKAYPRKEAKKAAWNKWRTLKPDLETVLKAIKIQRQSEQWQKDGGQFIPHPDAWLNKGRWEDEPATATATQEGDGRQDSVGPCPDWRDRLAHLKGIARERVNLSWTAYECNDPYLRDKVLAVDLSNGAGA